MTKKQAGKQTDFSAKSVNKAVALDVLEHPGFLYPAAGGVLGGLAALLLGANPVVLAIAAGGLGIAGLSWLINFGLRREHFANLYVRKIFTRMERQRREQMNALRKSLDQVDCAEGEAQFGRLNEKFSAFQRMLSDKLNPAELTYGRYLGMGEQVYLGSLDNLQRVVNTLKTVQVIDDEYISKRLKELQRKTGSDNAKEVQSLQERQDLRNRQLVKVQQLLAQNEEAMTKIDLTIAAIADMETEPGQASMQLDAAMMELQRLAQRAKHYSTNVQQGEA